MISSFEITYSIVFIYLMQSLDCIPLRARTPVLFSGEPCSWAWSWAHRDPPCILLNELMNVEGSQRSTCPVLLSLSHMLRRRSCSSSLNAPSGRELITSPRGPSHFCRDLIVGKFFLTKENAEGLLFPGPRLVLWSSVQSESPHRVAESHHACPRCPLPSPCFGSLGS